MCIYGTCMYVHAFVFVSLCACRVVYELECLLVGVYLCVTAFVFV